MRLNTINTEKIGAYNANVSKANFINSLSEDEIKHYDRLLGKKVSAESQIAQKAYSRNSDIFNNYYRLSKEEFKDILKLENLAIKQVEQDITNLAKSSFVLKEELVVFRGFNRKSISSIKLKEYGGFISTSLDKAIAMGYARNTGTTIECIIPKGTPVM